MTFPIAKASALLILGSMSACEQRETKVSERELQELRSELPGITERCLQAIRLGGLEAFPTRVDDCFEMLPAQRWKGMWRRDFEVSQFCRSPARSCSFDTTDAIWLTFAGTPEKMSERVEGLYAIEFVGRRTRREGFHGHLGAFEHEVVVDKLISLQPVDEDRR